MQEDSADDGDFSNMALCVCSSAENINASEDELEHIQSLLPERFHHLLCSYIPLDSTSPTNVRTAESCSDVDACLQSSERDITDFASVSDASCGYCLSTVDSSDPAVCEQSAVMCHLNAADAVTTVSVTADDFLHVVSNSQLTTATNNSQDSLSASNADADAHIIAVNSANDDDNCDTSSGFHIGRVGFKAKLRVNVETLTELELWQKDFAERSRTTMRYANVSICTGKKTLYKTRLRCQHNTFPRSASADKRKSSKNTHCPAVMNLTLKRSEITRKLKNSREVRRSNRSLDVHMPDYPLVVTVEFNHNHPLDTVSVLRHRDVAPYVSAKFVELLSTGHSPLDALAIHKYDLYLQHGAHQYMHFVSDRHHFPDVGWCYRQHYKLQKSAEGRRACTALRDCVDECSSRLRETVERLTSTDVQTLSDHPLHSVLQLSSDESRISMASVTSDESFVAHEVLADADCALAVCTPLMKRVHRLVPQAADVVVVDVGPPVDKRRRCRVVILVTSSTAGGLPLGVLAATSDASLRRAVELYAGLLDARCFYGRGAAGPSLLLVDDCPALRSALETVFSAPACLLCTYRLLISYWRELWDRRSAVAAEHRPHCFALFRAALLGDTVDELDANFAVVQGDRATAGCTSIQSHVAAVYERRAEWSVCCQKPPASRAAPRGAAANRALCRLASRALKDAVLDYVKSTRTPETLVTFVCGRCDGYYERRLTDTVAGRLDEASAVRFMQDCDVDADVVGTVPPSHFDVTVQPAAAGLSNVDGTLTGACQHVELSVGLCSCAAGCGGAPCVHQWATVLHTRARSWLLGPVATAAAQRVLAHIATGLGCAEAGWFASLHPLQSSGEDSTPVDDIDLSSAERLIAAEETVVEAFAPTAQSADSCLSAAAAPPADITDNNKHIIINWNGLAYEVSLHEQETLVMEPSEALTSLTAPSAALPAPPTRDRLRQSLAKIENAYIGHSDVMETAVSAFCQTVESIEVLDHLNSALLCFGNSFLTSGSATLSWS